MRVALESLSSPSGGNTVIVTVKWEGKVYCNIIYNCWRSTRCPLKKERACLKQLYDTPNIAPRRGVHSSRAVVTEIDLPLFILGTRQSQAKNNPIFLITIKPERNLPSVAERRLVHRIGLTSLVEH